MHIARIETRSLDETAEANDLGQSAAELVFLSFTDSDLAAFASAYARWPEPRPSLRLANLAALKHPYSVDLYLEKVCAGARFVLVRLLGGMDYWRYGVEELAALAKAKGIALALVPGDRFDDARLAEASTLDAQARARLWRYFEEGGPENMAACLAFVAGREAPEAKGVAAFGVYEERRAPPLTPPRKDGEGNEQAAVLPSPFLRGGAGGGALTPSAATARRKTRPARIASASPPADGTAGCGRRRAV